MLAVIRRAVAVNAAVSAIVAAALVAPASATQSPAESSCPAATVPSPGLALAPSSGAQLPVGTRATLVASGPLLPLPRGQAVTFQVVCGPDKGRTTTVKAAVDHKALSTAAIAKFSLTNSGSVGTDVVAVSSGSGAHKRGPIRATVTWVPPVDCGKPLAQLGYLTALRCKAKAAQPMLTSILNGGECLIGITSIFAPALGDAVLAARMSKLVKLLTSAPRDLTVAKIVKNFGVETPMAQLALDLEAMHRRGEVKDFTKLLVDSKDLPGLLRNLRDLLADVKAADVKKIGLDVLKLSSLGPCVDLLQKIFFSGNPEVTTTNLPAAKLGSAYRAALTTADHRTGTWTKTSGTLPAGLTLSGYTIAGIPTTPGTSTFTVVFKDTKKHTATAALKIVVIGASWPTKNNDGPAVLYAYFGAEFEDPQWVSCLADNSYCIADLNDGYVHVIQLDGLNDVAQVPTKTTNPVAELTGIGFSAGQAAYLVKAH